MLNAHAHLLGYQANFGWSLRYIHASCMRAAKALASLHICADSPEHSLLADEINTGTEI